jgi:glycogen debranching enzyme
LVANPAFADREAQSRFDNTAYHGTVVWSWQQAVFAAGLSRQLARTDLPADLRTRLQAARSQLWKAIDAGSALRSSELWSWSFANGQYRPEAFGQHNTHADESNAAQLWSTVYLSFQNGEWLGARQAR